MAQTFQSLFKTTLGAKLAVSDTTATLATVPTVTSGRLLLKSRTGAITELVSFTGVSGSTVTGLTRNLSLTADAVTGGTGLTWKAGTQVILVAMHDQLYDKDQDLNITEKTVSGVVVNSLTTAQRDALSSPPNGGIIYNTTAGEFQIRQGGAWSAMASGSTQPNSSTTVAGKVETATSAESIAGTATGGTGANLFVLPGDIAANEQSGTFVYASSADVSDTYTASLTPALTAYTTGMRVRIKFTTANTGACTINLNSLGAKSIKLTDGNDPLDGDIAASGIYDLVYDGTNMVLQKVAVRASDSDASTGTNTVKFMTPKQTKDNYLMVTDTITFTRAGDAASGDVSYNHGLGKTPKLISFHAVYASDNYSHGAYDGSSNTCVYSQPSIATATNCIQISTVNNMQGTVTAMTTTNFTISWVKGGTGVGASNINVQATLIA